MHFLRQETLAMPAYASEISGEIAQSPAIVHCAHFFGITTASQLRGSATSAASAHPVHRAQDEATHTDPQILFSVMTP